MSRVSGQCKSGHICLGVVSLGVKKDPPNFGISHISLVPFLANLELFGETEVYKKVGKQE